MPPIYLPRSDKELETWATYFSNGLTTYGMTLGIDASKVKSFLDAKATFSAALVAHDQAVNAAKGARQAKEQARRTLVTVAGQFNTLVQTNANATPQIKANMGLKVHQKPVPVTPTVPTELVVTGLDTGVNALKWKAGGNKAGTDYVIEALYSGASEWTYVDVVSRTRYEHNGQAPGVKVVYRIKARRRTVFSGTSNQAAVYDTPAPPALVLKKAA